MSVIQSNRTAKLLQREIDLVTELHSVASKNGPLDVATEDSFARFIQYKQERLTEVLDAEVASSHLVQLANDVADLRLQQRLSDTALIKRGILFYSVPNWPTELLEELQTYFQRMELAHREGDIFLFGSYVMRQVEAIANYYINEKIGLSVVSADLYTELSSGKGERRKLVDWISTGSSLKAKGLRDKFRQPNQTVVGSDLELMVKIKYLFWVCNQKKENKSPFLKYDPFNYLATARNKASHGYFKASTSDEQIRYENMKNNSAIYFMEFYSILNDLRVTLN